MPSAAPEPDLATLDPAALARFRRAFSRQHEALAQWSPDDRIGVAVSGGTDSLALLLLATAVLPGRVEAATVDHGLRPESASEANMVAEVCAKLGVPHQTLRGNWDSNPKEGLQAAARDYRYRELGAWCGRRRLRLLVTAHHADDQAETVLMRLSRGAGVRGLGSIRPARRLIGSTPVIDGRTGADRRRDPWSIFLLRPLLRFTKAELISIVEAVGLVPVDDPSNASDRFDRTRARRLLAETPWLEPARLAATASHLADADEALAWAANREFDRRVRNVEQDDVSAEFNEWLLDPADLPDEILRRVVDRTIRKVEDHAMCGYQGPDPSGPELTRFVARLQAGLTATMWHVLARPGASWRFSIAPPRRP
jgi:tRNA(Ile)-lysidine synthase